jgi:hypothetical protein
VDALIERIDQAARAYPHAGEYAAWPGPNSNTFTAHVARVAPNDLVLVEARVRDEH